MLTYHTKTTPPLVLKIGNLSYEFRCVRCSETFITSALSTAVTQHFSRMASWENTEIPMMVHELTGRYHVDFDLYGLGYQEDRAISTNSYPTPQEAVDRAIKLAHDATQAQVTRLKQLAGHEGRSVYEDLEVEAGHKALCKSLAEAICNDFPEQQDDE